MRKDAQLFITMCVIAVRQFSLWSHTVDDSQKPWSLFRVNLKHFSSHELAAVGDSKYVFTLYELLSWINIPWNDASCSMNI